MQSPRGTAHGEGEGEAVLTVALTGGIGSGKSAVSRLFRELGGAVVDADEISRALTAPGGPAVAAIGEKLGREFVDQNGGLRRAELRRAVFADGEKRAMLEKILHPRIRRRMDSAAEELRKKNAPYCILSIPLLLETAQENRADLILAVDAPQKERLRRVCRRDGVTEVDARRIMAAQVARKQLLARADQVIDNSGDLHNLRRQVERLHRRWSRGAA